MASHIVSVTEFKAKCLSLLNEVASEGGTITVTKRGQPLVTVNPAKKKPFKSSRGILRGKVHIPDEILMADMSDLYTCLNEKENFGL